jgi:DNA-directed RNA polymerase subunit F
MNLELILELAEKVYGECNWHDSALTHLEQFAELVAEHEREACAKLCEEYFERVMASRIRARGQE